MKQVVPVLQRIVNSTEAELRADKEYRKGVHWLETLRIRRKRVLEGAYKVYILPCLLVGESQD